MLSPTQSIPSLISIKYEARRMSFFWETFFSIHSILWWGWGKLKKFGESLDTFYVITVWLRAYAMLRDLGVFLSRMVFSSFNRFRTLVISYFSPSFFWKIHYDIFIGLMDCLAQSWWDPGEIECFGWECEEFWFNQFKYN